MFYTSVIFNFSFNIRSKIRGIIVVPICRHKKDEFVCPHKLLILQHNNICSNYGAPTVKNASYSRMLKGLNWEEFYLFDLITIPNFDALSNTQSPINFFWYWTSYQFDFVRPVTFTVWTIPKIVCRLKVNSVFIDELALCPGLRPGRTVLKADAII